jgi:dCTP deaminase
MLLPAQAIRFRSLWETDQDGSRLRNATHPLIRPFHERTVANGFTFGLSSCGYDIRIAEHLRLEPGDFKLASSMEQFDLHNDVMMMIVDKSSWARRGVAVQNTVAEPGWRGYLTLEISYHGRDLVVIQEGTPIAQVLFMRLTEATRQPYQGRYQDQPAGAQPAIAAKEGDL